MATGGNLEIMTFVFYSLWNSRWNQVGGRWREIIQNARFLKRRKLFQLITVNFVLLLQIWGRNYFFFQKGRVYLVVTFENIIFEAVYACLRYYFLEISVCILVILSCVHDREIMRSWDDLIYVMNNCERYVFVLKSGKVVSLWVWRV